VDFGAALAQLAKFGGNLILTTQGTRFLGRTSASDEPEDPEAFSKVLANVDTLVVYRVSGEDAVALSETEFVGEQDAPDLIYLGDHQAFVRFVREGQVVGPLRVEMDPPPPRDPRVEARILAGRSAYLLPLAQALEMSRAASHRMPGAFAPLVGMGNAAGPRPTTPQGTTSTVAPGEEAHPGVPDPTDEVQALLEGGIVGLGREKWIDTFKDLLGRVSGEEGDEAP
jgi:hypothetical protein